MQSLQESGFDAAKTCKALQSKQVASTCWSPHSKATRLPFSRLCSDCINKNGVAVQIWWLQFSYKKSDTPRLHWCSMATIKWIMGERQNVKRNVFWAFDFSIRRVQLTSADFIRVEEISCQMNIHTLGTRCSRCRLCRHYKFSKLRPSRICRPSHLNLPLNMGVCMHWSHLNLQAITFEKKCLFALLILISIEQ